MKLNHPAKAKGGQPSNRDGAWHGQRQRFEFRSEAHDRRWKTDTGRVQRAECHKGMADRALAVCEHGQEPEEAPRRIRRQPERSAGRTMHEQP